MPRERNSKKRNSLSDALTTVRPTFKAPSTAKRPSPSHMSPMPPGPRRKASPAPPVPPAPSRTFPASERLSLAFKRQVLSTARAYLSEKQEERRPGDRLGLRCAVLASRRTSKASRFIRNLKENAIEQKLLAVEKRMQHMEDGDETSGPDQMLDEACQLAAQLHELSNNDSINLEIGQIAESITVCTDLLNNLRATGLSHTLHLEQIAEDLNGVHEGHGISKALLSELQKDIAAMRAAIESMKIASGTVAPVAAPSGCPTSVDLAESMCPLLESLEERTSLLLSEMGEAGEASIVQESDLVVKGTASTASEAENFSDEVTTDAGPSCFPASTRRVEEFLSESASRWIAQEDSPSNCLASQVLAATRSEPSRLPWDDCRFGGVQGEELDVEPFGGGTSFPTGGVVHAHSDGHVLSSQSDLPDGLGSSKPWRLRLFGWEDTASGCCRNVDVEAHEGDGGDRAAAVLPSYFEADAGRLPRLLHSSAAEKLSTKAAGDDAALPSPFFPTAEAVHGDDGSEPASESSGQTSEGEFLFRSLDLPMFLGDLQRERHLHNDVDVDGDAAGGGYGPDATDVEWSLKSLGPEEWELMALCLDHCPGQGAELRRRLLEPIGFWPRIEESATPPVGPVGPILLLRPDRDEAQRRASHASLASATAKWGMDSYLRRKRRSTLPQILGLPPQAVKA